MANIAEDVELGEVALILGVVVIGGYFVYKALDKAGVLDLAKTTPNTAPTFANGTPSGPADTSFVSKIIDNTFSVDTSATKAGYGPTLSQAAGDFWTSPWEGTKAIVSGWFN